MNVSLERIPQALREVPNWILWRAINRGGKETKLPVQMNGEPAESNNPQTWTTFDAILPWVGGDDGLGFVFSANDEFCGIDLDGCRDPETGKVADWAREILVSMDTYSEVSPSMTGVKMFLRGSMPNGMGRKQNKIPDAPILCSKTPQVELYDRGRFFTMTGIRLGGLPAEPQDRQKQLDELLAKLFVEAVAPKADFRSNDAVIQRARLYLRKLPPAVSKQKGHDRTFHAACILVLGFGLNELEAMDVLSEWNQTCQPPWNDKELLHKIQSAGKQGGERNYLRNATPERWVDVSVPAYDEPPPKQSQPIQPVKSKPKKTLLADAAKAYLDVVRKGGNELIELGMPDVDHAIGGGVEKGELIILAARPSHGKSAVAMQIVHHWTSKQMPCLVISEEMSALALGKRAIQFISETPQEHWKTQHGAVTEDLDWHFDNRAPAYIVESCGTTEEVVAQIEQAVAEDGIKGVVVDYAQLLRNAGKTRYEQVTNTSIMLKAVAQKHQIPLLMLCQLSRDIEGRQKFAPCMSDLKESGQLEQDADVILFLVWPHRIDTKQPAEEYLLFAAKNRNRPIVQGAVKQRFIPSRQTVAGVKHIPATRFAELDGYNDRDEEGF